MNINSFIDLDKLTRFEASGLGSEAPFEVIVKYNGDIERVGRELNSYVEILTSNYAILTVPLKNLYFLYGYPEVEYVELPKNVTFMLRESLSNSGINTVQQASGLGLLGSGVMIGIIDSGIDYTHPDFRNPDGTSRIMYLWDQSISGTPPPGFRDGTEYTNEQLNEALASEDPLSVVPSEDVVGHGTAVAGVAAGNGTSSGSAYRGVAPLSALTVVKLRSSGAEAFMSRNTDIMRGVKYIIDRAQQALMPVSINISYGTNNGSHDNSSLFEQYLNTMCDRWKTVISVATGNEGASGHHFFAHLTQSGQVTVEFAVSGNRKRIYLTLWKDFVDTINFELISPDGHSTGIIIPTQSITRANLKGTTAWVLSIQPNHYSVGQEIYFLLQNIAGEILQGVWKIIIRGIKIYDGRFDIWLPTTEDVTSSTSFLEPNIDITLTIPSTAIKVISVGGYNSDVNNAADFSGRGPLRDSYYIRPDLVAPAVDITSVKAGGGYDVFTGTSLAAPFVTGSAALMMEWGISRGNDLFMYGQRVKAFLRRGASKLFNIEYPNNVWGYGALSLFDTMKAVLDFSAGGGLSHK